MNTIHQKYLRKDFVIRLKAEAPRNIAHYESDKPWLSEYAIGSAYEMESGLERPADLTLQLPDRANRDLKDYENACIIHEAFITLNPAQASDARLWTYLTHVDCWDYMRSRWPVPPSSKKETSRTNFIRSHYFIETSSSRSFTRNGIAGLWWLARLTYDTNRPNRYELTNILLKKLDVTKNFVERNLGRNSNMLRGFLELLAEDQTIADQLGGGENGRAAVRALTRRLNAYGGVSLLDQLDKNEVKELIRRSMKAISSDGSVEDELANPESASDDNIDDPFAEI